MKKLFVVLMACLLLSCEQNENLNNKIETPDVVNEVVETVENIQEDEDNIEEETKKVVDQETSSDESFDIVVIADVLNVRQSYDIESDIVSQLDYGQICSVLEVQNDDLDRLWYKIDENAWIAGWFCYDYFKVSTIEEFAEAIGSNRMIKLTSSMSGLDFDLQDEENSNEHIDNNKIIGVSNLIIEGDRNKPQRYFTNRDDTVLTFEYCENIKVIGLDIGHELGPCSGDVIKIFDSTGVSIENSILYGCGRHGINATSSQIYLYETMIWDCFESALLFDEDSQIVLDKCVIKDLPAILPYTNYATRDSFTIKNSIIQVPIVQEAYFFDSFLREGQGVYRSNEMYYNIKIEDSILMPIALEDSNQVTTLADSLNTIDMTSIYRIKAFPRGQKFGLQVDINYAALEDDKTLNITRLIEEVVSKAEASDLILEDMIYGTVIDDQRLAARWSWNPDNKQVEEYEIYYPYTEDFYGLASIDFTQYLESILDIESIVTNTNVDVEILPSDISNGELIHRAAFDLISSDADFAEYMGTMMYITYNQTTDDLLVGFDNKTYTSFGYTDELKTLVETYMQMRELLKTNEVLETNGAYEYVYDLSEEEYQIVVDAMKTTMTETERTALEAVVSIKYDKNKIYTKESIPEFLYDLSLDSIVLRDGDFALISMKDIYTFDLDFASVHKIDGQYKLDTIYEYQLYEREWSVDFRFDHWKFNFSNYNSQSNRY